MRNPLLEVTPVIPPSLARLPELAGNLFFGWHRPTRALFEDLDTELWRQTGGNPRLMLRCLPQATLDRAAKDSVYLARYRQAVDSLDAYLSESAPGADQPLTAYFCAEYGFHESFPIYSGGLGGLAGGYCKRRPRTLPVDPARRADAQWLKVSVRIAGRDVHSRLWKAQVGRIPV